MNVPDVGLLLRRRRFGGSRRNFFAGGAFPHPMQPVSPHRWRALPTALLVICAIALGAVTARADDLPHHRAAASTSSAMR
jgi:hypothetical protein